MHLWVTSILLRLFYEGFCMVESKFRTHKYFNEVFIPFFFCVNSCQRKMLCHRNLLWDPRLAVLFRV